MWARPGNRRERVMRQTPRHRAFRASLSLVLGGLLPFLGACPPEPPQFAPDPIGMQRATGIVNGNIARIAGTLRASGSVDGYFRTAEGNRRSYHLDGVLFYLAPFYLRFDLRALGSRQFLFGSNREVFWAHSRQENRYRCVPRGQSDELGARIPVRPDQLIDALGLSPIPTSPSGSGGVEQVQRVAAEHQQILFLVHDERGIVTLEKEYWLDRYNPRLVRRVVFRDADGVITLESKLDDYRAAGSGGPLLPHTIAMEWPRLGSQMRFRVGKWTILPNLGPQSPQFRVPKECADAQTAGS